MCQEHFEEDLFLRKTKNQISLKPNSVPTKSPNNMGNEIGIETATVDDAVDIVATVPEEAPAATSSDKNTTVTASSSLPSATLSESSGVAAVISALENITISKRPEIREIPSPSSHILSIAPANDNENCSKCKNCLLKDELIEEKNAQIKSLRRRLKKAQEKVWHLEAVKKKFNSTILELKENSFLNEEQLKDLTVCFQCFQFHRSCDYCYSSEFKFLSISHDAHNTQ